MTTFVNNNFEKPYQLLQKYHSKANKNNQSNIEGICISSYSKKLNEVNSRYVNLKIVDNDRFIFFSNYNSQKSLDFILHDQISALIFWDTINIQIRMKAKIKKTSSAYNQIYFFNRLEEKNALSISSKQSKPIKSYNQVKENYNKSLKNDDLKKCPEFWGGYSFTPYYFEFWEGHGSRLNKREVYEKSDDSWKYFILQP